METTNITNNNTPLFKFMLFVNFFIIGFWLVGLNVNVYRYKLGGILFELFWLPVILCMIAVPIIAIYFWAKSNFTFKSKFLFLFICWIFSVAALYIVAQ